MNMYTAEQIAEILRKQAAWASGFPGGEVARFSGANLEGANLENMELAGVDFRDANLQGANFRNANLRGVTFKRANLKDANFEDAYLSGANFDGADVKGANFNCANCHNANFDNTNLEDANLTVIRDDVRAVLDAAPNEVAGLLRALRNGRIDGSTYHGPCACLVGTLANVRGCTVETVGILMDTDRPAERWCLAIKRGHRPDWCPVARITDGWIVAWMTEHGQPFQLSREEALQRDLDAALTRIAELEDPWQKGQ